MKIDELLIRNYLPYAKSVIVDRAIPFIDGFKPVQRRILYCMGTLNLLDGPNAKSQRIVGDTMGKYHPHGDSAIYEAIQLMTTAYEGLNVPYIKSKGSFGKSYSRDLKCAKPRYTEAKLAPICREILSGLNENAVDFVDNFDASLKEPALLPVKFPNILVNNNPGVAVGTSSSIPCFSLKNVCLATQGVIDGSIKTAKQLSKVLGAPEFTTGGFLHASEKALESLCETGRGKFMISGKVELYNDRIVITEIPYTTTCEDIMDAIEEAWKEKKLVGVSEVNDEIGLDGLRIIIQVKRGYNTRDILNQINRLTTLRTSISFRTRVIINDRCLELGLLDLIKFWIEFREECVKRIYQYRLEKDTEKEHILSSWAKIINDLQGVASIISKNTESVAKDMLMQKYGLDSEQAEYILDLKIRNITLDRAKKSLEKLNELLKSLEYTKKVVYDSAERKNVIFNELSEIITKYGTENKTILTEELKEDDMKVTPIKINDDLVTVVYTKQGYVRRLTALKDIAGKYVSKSGDEEVLRWVLKNNEHLLVFDRYGTVHKVLVDSIDSSSKANMVDKLYEIAGLEKAEDMIWADACGDYTGYFNLVYPTGRGKRVYYSKALGNRSQYKSLYEAVTPGRYWITQENKFFMITHRLKAAYCDISRLGLISTREAFKVARVASGDYFTRLQPYKDVPNVGLINLDKYNKDYTVLIGDDILWVDEKQIQESRKMMAKIAERYNQNVDTSENSSDSTEESKETDEN